MTVPGDGSSSTLTSGRLLARNVMLNAAGGLVPAVAMLVAIPTLIRALGDARFGIVALAICRRIIDRLGRQADAAVSSSWPLSGPTMRTSVIFTGLDSAMVAKSPSNGARPRPPPTRQPI